LGKLGKRKTDLAFAGKRPVLLAHFIQNTKKKPYYLFSIIAYY